MEVKLRLHHQTKQNNLVDTHHLGLYKRKNPQICLTHSTLYFENYIFSHDLL